MGARYGDTPVNVGSVIPVTSTVTLSIGSGPVVSVDSLAMDEADPMGAHTGPHTRYPAEYPEPQFRTRIAAGPSLPAPHRAASRGSCP